MTENNPRMNTDERGLLYEEPTEEIIGCPMDVLNNRGGGFLEKPYENALTVEFDLKNIPYSQQERFQIDYKGVQIGEYIPDLLVFDKIVVDTKVIDRITESEVGQMLNDLKITDNKVGLILNFDRSELAWKRVVR